MKWIYFGLAVFTGLSAVLIAFYAPPQEKAGLLRPCITAFVVNFVIFYAMHWAQTRRKEADPISHSERP